MPIDWNAIWTALLDPKNWISLIVASTGLTAGIRAWWESRHAAKKTWVETIEQTLTIQVDWLDKRIGRLQAELDASRQSAEQLQARLQTLENELESERVENGHLRNQVECLELERSWLKAVLEQHGITVPPMPEDWTPNYHEPIAQ